MGLSKKKVAVIPSKPASIEASALFERVSAIIENRKSRAGAYANHEITLMYWEVGQYAGSVLLGGERAEYGRKIVSKLSEQLKEHYGSSFDYTNIRRMMQFAARFPDFEIVAPVAQQLSWSHFIELLPLKSKDDEE
jgi:hypothetical protein